MHLRGLHVNFVPSASDLFFEYDGAHDGGYDHAERIEGRDEHRASLPRHDTLHVVRHAGAHYALCTSSSCMYVYGVKIDRCTSTTRLSCT